jgi:pimeloyl-ACP methyl ester carboxylesterase
LRTLICLSMLAACNAESGDTGPSAVDYSQPGSQSVQVVSGETTLTSCTMPWSKWSPATPSGPIVLLSHGFARSSAQMVGWGSHLASHGVTVVTPDLCHATFTDADHPQNAADLVELARELSPDPVLYAGHSAGGLASLLTAAADSSALGVFTLDGVDRDDLGRDAAEGLSAPFAGLFGESSSCNAENNGLSWISTDRPAWRVPGASHCDFENPTDPACSVLCGESDTDAAGVPTVAIARAFTAWAVSMALGTADRQTVIDTLVAQGQLEGLQP